jgi:hypothetical protein
MIEEGNDLERAVGERVSEVVFDHRPTFLSGLE